MADLYIDRLTLEMPGLSPEAGRRLAEMVASGLHGVVWPQSPPERIGAVVTVEPGSGGLEALASTILAEIGRQLR